MFYTGLSGLNAAQAALVTTGHNTANVNTPGYSRQSAQVATAGGVYRASVGFFGSGAKVVDVTRSYDAYLASQLNQAQSLNQSLTTYYTQISQIDNLLANQKAGLAPQLQSLFTNIQAVANTPADPAARQQLISSAQAAANQFRSMDQYLSGLNNTTNDQISGTVDQINSYAEQIASLNKQVALLSNASGGQAPNDLLDQRDQLVNQLGLLVGTKLEVQDGGQYNISIGNGQSLVLGDSASKLAAVRSAADPSRTAVAVVNALPVPAQSTSTRSWPCAARALAKAASTCSSDVTSTLQKMPPSSFASASPCSALRSKSATFTPWPASRRAVAAPRPEAPPVTTAAMLESSCICWCP